MKKRFPGIVLILIFLTGAGIFCYPTLSDQWNRFHQSRAIATYQEAVDTMEEQDFTYEWEQARAYNDSLGENTFNQDVFDQGEEDLENMPYWNYLNLGGNGIMGYISIPEIDQQIPIYHGTADTVLQIGAGHILGTGLPAGGEGTHSVIAGHRGLPSARLFTDIDQLEIGDKFYLHILDQVLAYEVDEIHDMVDKNDLKTLTSLMAIQPGEDLVTLFTCTPYGVNSHRLLVRGSRTEYHGEDQDAVLTEHISENMLRSIQDYYMLYALLAVAAALLLAVAVRVIRSLRAAGRSGRKKNE